MHIEKSISLTPIEQLVLDASYSNTPKVWVKREDLCHPIISGNKWHKLYLNIKAAKSQGYRKILSFGGAWSNHIHALAYVCDQEGLELVALIRGDELTHKPLNPMLRDATSWHANLQFISREEYAQKNQQQYLQSLTQNYGSVYIIPEGGANSLGVQGSELFAQATLKQYFESQLCYPTHVVLSCGSGTMAAGFLRACSSHAASLAIQLNVYPSTHASKAKQTITKLALNIPCSHTNASVSESLSPDCLVIQRSHRLPFGKVDSSLKGFINHFESFYEIPIEPVYHAKLFDNFLEDLKEDEYPLDSRILIIHSGGLQGARSLKG